MVDLRRVPGEGRLVDAHAVRRAVFVEGQGVSEAEEMDGRDDEATHVVAYETGRPVGTGRLRIPEPGVAKPERLAVLAPFRGRGIGRQIVRTLESVARERGCERARLHAQTTVESFYHELGYSRTSGVFEEAGIPHVEMQTQL